MEPKKSFESSKLDKPTEETSRGKYRQPGFHSVKATSLFRTFNFELFVRPNKYVMGFGLIAITGCVSYLAYMNAVAENRAAGLYEIYDSEGNIVTTERKYSKWN